MHVTLCTGRMLSGTQPYALELGLDAPLGCVDGSHVADALTGRALHCATLERSALSQLFAVLTAHEAAPFAFSDELMFHDEGGHRYLDYVRAWSRRTHLVPDLSVNHSWQDGRAIPAVLALGSQERMREAERVLAKDASHSLQSVCFESLCELDADGRRPWALLVRAAGIDKGTAVAWMAAHYGIELDEVVALGDWINDVPMFRRVGLSFAMAQAPAVVQEAAHAVLRADDESGGAILEAAERAGLL